MEKIKKKIDIKRITSALLGFPLVVLVLTLGNKYVVDVFLAIIAAIAMQEYLNAISKDSKPIRWIGYISCILIALIHIGPEKLDSLVIENFNMLIIPILLLILFTTIIVTDMKINFKDISYTLFGIIYVITCISFIAQIRGMENGRYLVWFAIIAAWGTDTFAYIIGKRFGKHKFSEVSPKKSIEGCIAGIVGAVIIALIYTYAINMVNEFNYSYLYVTIFTIILSIIGQIGDFAASSIKRYVDVKDYSNLIPGHGGMLDRIDSLMFLAPFAYVFLSMILLEVKLINFIVNALKIIFLLGFLIFIHEGGHFCVAKLCKIKVKEFAIGFGKIIWQKQGKETKYTLRLIPLGGFCSMEGEDEESDDDRAFSKASVWKRMAIVFAGQVVNIVFGLLVYYILVASIGIQFANPIDDTISNRIIYSGKATWEFIVSIFDSVNTLFTGGTSVDQMVGIVGISEIVVKTSGIANYINLMALISISLGITNLLPIPALDGGKILILIIEVIRRKQMKVETEAKIQMIGFSILLALSLIVTYNDIIRIL